GRRARARPRMAASFAQRGKSRAASRRRAKTRRRAERCPQGGGMTDLAPRAVSALGFLVWMVVAWALSENRRSVPWATVVWGIALQLGLGLVLLKTPFGHGFFALMTGLVDALQVCTDAGARFVFGALFDAGFSFAVKVLPTIVFMSCLFAVLYHVGV